MLPSAGAGPAPGTFESNSKLIHKAALSPPSNASAPGFMTPHGGQRSYGNLLFICFGEPLVQGARSFLFPGVLAVLE